jgi:hypothetical protein
MATGRAIGPFFHHLNLPCSSFRRLFEINRHEPPLLTDFKRLPASGKMSLPFVLMSVKSCLDQILRPPVEGCMSHCGMLPRE